MSKYSTMKVEESDWQKFRNLRLTAVASDAAAFGDTHEALTKQPDQFWIDKIKSSHIFVLETENKFVGMIVFKRDDDGVWSIKSLWVNPAHRNRGLAQKLIEIVLNTAREMGVETIELGVNSKLINVVELYKSYNFKIINTHKDELMGNGTTDDLHVMRLNL